MTDSRTVLAVVCFLGLLSIVGLGGLVWLVDHGATAEGIAVVAGPTGTAIGALGTLLATTRTVNPVEVADTARNEALADVASLALDPGAEPITVEVSAVEEVDEDPDPTWP